MKKTMITDKSVENVTLELARIALICPLAYHYVGSVPESLLIWFLLSFAMNISCAINKNK